MNRLVRISQDYYSLLTSGFNWVIQQSDSRINFSKTTQYSVKIVSLSHRCFTIRKKMRIKFELTCIFYDEISTATLFTRVTCQACCHHETDSDFYAVKVSCRILGPERSAGSVYSHIKRRITTSYDMKILRSTYTYIFPSWDYINLRWLQLQHLGHKWNRRDAKDKSDGIANEKL